jgi:hypothetical protein
MAFFKPSGHARQEFALAPHQPVKAEKALDASVVVDHLHGVFIALFSIDIGYHHTTYSNPSVRP